MAATGAEEKLVLRIDVDCRPASPYIERSGPGEDWKNAKWSRTTGRGRAGDETEEKGPLAPSSSTSTEEEG